jgi:hypothetical protein
MLMRLRFGSLRYWIVGCKMKTTKSAKRSNSAYGRLLMMGEFLSDRPASKRSEVGEKLLLRFYNYNKLVAVNPIYIAPS